MITPQLSGQISTTVNYIGVVMALLSLGEPTDTALDLKPTQWEVTLI